MATPGSGDTLAPGSVCRGGTASCFHQATPSKGARHQNPNTCTSSNRAFIASCALNHTGPKPAQRGAGRFPGAERGCPAAPPRERLLPALPQLFVTTLVTFRKRRGAAAAHTALAPPRPHLPPQEDTPSSRAGAAQPQPTANIGRERSWIKRKEPGTQIKHESSYCPWLNPQTDCHVQEKPHCAPAPTLPLASPASPRTPHGQAAAA